MPSSEDANFSDNFSQMSYVKPKKRCPLWFYNPRTREFLGRTGKSWCSIFWFYVIYYAFLAGFFMGMMMINLHFVVPTDVPLRTGDNSLLKLTPGLGFKPIADIEKTLISYSRNDPQTYEPYVQNLDAFLNDYYDINSKTSENFATCKNGNKEPNDVEKICKFNLAELGPCGKDKYGYNTDKPCVILKLNKIYGWMPDIEDEAKNNNPLVTCSAQNPYDTETIGTMKYYPQANATHGKFDNVYFPYLGQKSYLAPLVAVQFESLKKHVVALVQCRVTNIKTKTYVDPVKFEIKVD